MAFVQQALSTQHNDERVTLRYEDAEFGVVMKDFRSQVSQRIFVQLDVKGKVSINVENENWYSALRTIADQLGLHITKGGDALHVTAMTYREAVEARKESYKRNQGKKTAEQLWKEEEARIKKYVSEREQARAEKAKREADQLKSKEIKRVYCHRLTDRKRKYDEDRTIWYRLDENGERVYLGEDEVNKKYQDFLNEIAEECY